MSSFRSLELVNLEGGRVLKGSIYHHRRRRRRRHRHHVSCHKRFRTGTNPLEPAVIPTTQASSFTL